jgi:hypothetical protein
MADYPSNSQRSKNKKLPEKKKVEQIVTGEVVRQKKPMGRRVKNMILGINPKGVWLHIWFNILIPAAQDTVIDSVEEALHRTIGGDSRYGDNRRNRSRSRNRNRGQYNDPGYVDYRGISRKPRDNRRDDFRDEFRDISSRGRAIHDFDEILLPSRVEADEVLDQMFEHIADYETVSVSDLYGFLGIDSSFTDQKWGWMDISTADITRVRGGKFLLDLPKPVPIDID